MKANKKDTWLVVDDDGKIYEKARRKITLGYMLKELKRDFCRRDLKIVRNDKV